MGRVEILQLMAINMGSRRIELNELPKRKGMEP